MKRCVSYGNTVVFFPKCLLLQSPESQLASLVAGVHNSLPKQSIAIDAREWLTTDYCPIRVSNGQIQLNPTTANAIAQKLYRQPYLS